MELRLNDDDLLPQHRELPVSEVEYKHLAPDAKMAVVMAGPGKSVFWRGDAYNAILVPRSMQCEPNGVSGWSAHWHNNGGFCLKWGGPIGFGECDIVLNKDGTVYVGDEYSGPEFVAVMLWKLIRDAKWECLPDRPAQKRYGSYFVEQAIEERRPGHEVLDWREERDCGLICVRARRKSDGAMVGFTFRTERDEFVYENTVREASWTEWPPVRTAKGEGAKMLEDLGADPMLIFQPKPKAGDKVEVTLRSGKKWQLEVHDLDGKPSVFPKGDAVGPLPLDDRIIDTYIIIKD